MFSYLKDKGKLVLEARDCDAVTAYSPLQPLTSLPSAQIPAGGPLVLWWKQVFHLHPNPQSLNLLWKVLFRWLACILLCKYSTVKAQHFSSILIHSIWFESLSYHACIMSSCSQMSYNSLDWKPCRGCLETPLFPRAHSETGKRLNGFPGP